MSKSSLLLVLVILVLSIVTLVLYSRVINLQGQSLRAKEQLTQLQSTCKSVRTEYEIEALSNNAWRSVEGGLLPKPIKLFPC